MFSRHLTLTLYLAGTVHIASSCLKLNGGEMIKKLRILTLSSFENLTTTLNPVCCSLFFFKEEETKGFFLKALERGSNILADGFLGSEQKCAGVLMTRMSTVFAYFQPTAPAPACPPCRRKDARRPRKQCPYASAIGHKHRFRG